MPKSAAKEATGQSWTAYVRGWVVKIESSDAFIMTDIQNDFCPGGALAVPEGDTIIQPVNSTARLFSTVVATQDWHPSDHCSFKQQGGPWPPHCIQNTWGSELHPLVDKKRIGFRIRKAQHRDRDAYSGFQETPLEEELKKRGVKRLFFSGLATDYCVKRTALDAIKRGFVAIVLTDLVRAINLRPNDEKKALEDMTEAGVLLFPSNVLE